MFTTDHGGTAMSLDDAKISQAASTWNTKLSQLGRMDGAVYVMSGALSNTDYIAQIVGKRPKDMWIIAHDRARADAERLHAAFPGIHIALHATVNAKVALVAPATVWFSSADFGKHPPKSVESEIGLHSARVFDQTLATLFLPTWRQSTRIGQSNDPPVMR